MRNPNETESDKQARIERREANRQAILAARAEVKLPDEIAGADDATLQAELDKTRAVMEVARNNIRVLSLALDRRRSERDAAAKVAKLTPAERAELLKGMNAVVTPETLRISAKP